MKVTQILLEAPKFHNQIHLCENLNPHFKEYQFKKSKESSWIIKIDINKNKIKK